MDKKKIMKSVKLFLEGIGEDPGRGGLKDTPKRVAEMCEEIFAGIGIDAGKQIKVLKSEDHDEIVLLKDIPIFFCLRTSFVAFCWKSACCLHT